ncbi:hypothetical protein HY224_02290 [Candidatus Uhrbacteria bacterium]|nr:hypothetical protein [Candidatus Uhrbacteria bacterium]
MTIKLKESRPTIKRASALEKLVQDLNQAEIDVRAGLVYTQAQMEKMLGITDGNQIISH